jgi:hypothetical protein
MVKLHDPAQYKVKAPSKSESHTNQGILEQTQ